VTWREETSRGEALSVTAPWASGGTGDVFDLPMRGGEASRDGIGKGTGCPTQEIKGRRSKARWALSRATVVLWRRNVISRDLHRVGGGG